MKLTHPVDERLTRVRIRSHAERWVFLSQTAERVTHAILVSLCLWLNGDRNHRLGKRDGFQHYTRALIAECIAGARAFQSDDSRNVARRDLRNVLTVIRVHLKHATNALAVVLR